MLAEGLAVGQAGSAVAARRRRIFSPDKMGWSDFRI
jgi:hypothetical protein